MATNKIIKPPIFLFFSHLVPFIISIILFLDILNMNLSIQISLIVHALGFIILLIFLTIDKFGAYLSWEIGYDFAYEEFLTSF